MAALEGAPATILRLRFIDSVNQHGRSRDICASFQLFSQPFSDSDRRLVVGMNHADHVVLTHFVECVLQEKPAALGRESFSLKLRRDRTTNLETRPAFGIRVPDPPNESTRCFLFCREIPVPEQLPVSDQERHVTPGFESRQWLPAEQ